MIENLFFKALSDSLWNQNPKMTVCGVKVGNP